MWLWLIKSTNRLKTQKPGWVVPLTIFPLDFLTRSIWFQKIQGAFAVWGGLGLQPWVTHLLQAWQGATEISANPNPQPQPSNLISFSPRCTPSLFRGWVYTKTRFWRISGILLQAPWKWDLFPWPGGIFGDLAEWRPRSSCRAFLLISAG